jgi:hypothetical protein
MSPYRATSPSVFRSPAPATRIGIFLTGGGLSTASRRSILASPASSSRARWAGGPNGKPYSAYSFSRKPAPTPRTSRPPLMWSTVLAMSASRSGLR